MNKLLFATALATLAVPVTSAGMYDQPYAIVESGDASEVRKEARLAISKVDGKSTRNPRKSDPIAPGKHSITLNFESARGIFRPMSVDFEIDLQPARAIASSRITKPKQAGTGNRRSIPSRSANASGNSRSEMQVRRNQSEAFDRLEVTWICDRSGGNVIELQSWSK